MKLLLLHGPGKIGSRAKLLDLKHNFDPNNVVVLEGDISAQTVLGNLATLPFLSENRLIILENPGENLIVNLPDIPSSITLAIWFDHEVNEKKNIFQFIKESNGEILFFPESKEISIFPFLDSLGIKDRQAFVQLNKLKDGGMETQYMITMLFYLLRSLVMETKTSHEFIRKKILKQKTNFPSEKIIELYRFILEIDFKIKKGLIENLHAEFLLVNRFLN